MTRMARRVRRGHQDVREPGPHKAMTGDGWPTRRFENKEFWVGEWESEVEMDVSDRATFACVIGRLAHAKTRC